MDGEARKARIVPALLMVFVALALTLAGVASATNAARSTSIALRPSAASTGPATTAVSGHYFDYFVIILMENENLCNVYTHCGGSGTYETSLADTYAIPLHYNYCNVNPSLPNYLCLSGGSYFGCSGYDGGPNSNTCTSVAWNSQNIVDRLVGGGVTWKAYMEDMPSNCDGSNSGNYAVRHDPFVYYHDNVANASRCSRIIPAGPSAGSDSAFLNDLNSTSTASNYMWLTPNVLNDGHDTGVAYADGYLAALVPQILSSPVFTTQRAALFISYDEGYGQPTYAVWAGPVVKHAYTSNVAYTHFSLLSTLEANWNLPYLNATNDGAASAMSEFFTSASPDFKISANPTHLTLLPSQIGNSTISVQAISGFTGTVALTTSSNPTGATASCSPSSVGPGGTSVCSLSAAAAGNYTVTVTGTSGSLVHQTAIALTVNPTPPPLSASFTYSPTSPAAGQSITFTGAASGGSAPYSYAWTFGDSHTATGAQVTHAYASAGNYTVTLTVADAATSTVHVSHIVAVSPPPPLTASFTFTPTSPVAGQTITFAATASGGTSPYTFAWDYGDGSTDSGASVSHSYAHSGNYTVVLTATDATSHTATSTHVVSVSTTPPAPVTTLHATGTSGSNGWYVSQVTATLNATDYSSTAVTIHWQLDSGSWQDYTGPFTIDAGAHTLAYYASDGAGLQESVQTASFNVDTAPPTVIVGVSGTSGANGWYVSVVEVSLQATDDASGVASVSYRVDGGAWQNYSVPFNLTDGRHTLEVAATDVAGLHSAGASRSVAVETGAPVFENVSPGGTVNESRVVVSWSATDLSGITGFQVSVDAAPFQDVGLNTAFQVELPNGNHTIQVRAVDVAGQTSTTTIHVQVVAGTPRNTIPPNPLMLMTEGLLVVSLVVTVAAGVHAHGNRKRARRQQLYRGRLRT